MSAAHDLFRELADHGVTVWQEAGQLRYKAPSGAMTPDLLLSLRAHKAELIDLLAANDCEANASLATSPRTLARREEGFTAIREQAREDFLAITSREEKAFSLRIAHAPARAIGLLVLTFEIDGRQATCVDPVSASLADAMADLRRQFPERVGRIWQQGIEVAA